MRPESAQRLRSLPCRAPRPARDRRPWSESRSRGLCPRAARPGRARPPGLAWRPPPTGRRSPRPGRPGTDCPTDRAQARSHVVTRARPYGGRALTWMRLGPENGRSPQRLQEFEPAHEADTAPGYVSFKLRRLQVSGIIDGWRRPDLLPGATHDRRWTFQGPDPRQRAGAGLRARRPTSKEPQGPPGRADRRSHRGPDAERGRAPRGRVARRQPVTP